MMALMVGLATLLVPADAVSEVMSAGSCYDSWTHRITCNVAEPACSSGSHWYAPGYVSTYSGCCHCRASCEDLDTENCSYADDIWGCYNPDSRQCACDSDERSCEASGGVWHYACASCAAKLEQPASAGAWGCYDGAVHQCSCNSNHQACEKGGGTWTDGCHSCVWESGPSLSLSAEVRVAEDLGSSGRRLDTGCDELEQSWGCFNIGTQSCECTISDWTCSEDPARYSWTEYCWSCCFHSVWGCYVPEEGCFCDLSSEEACVHDHPTATWSYLCHECEDADPEPQEERRINRRAILLLGCITGAVVISLVTATVVVFRMKSAKKWRGHMQNAGADAMGLGAGMVVVGRPIPGFEAPAAAADEPAKPERSADGQPELSVQV